MKRSPASSPSKRNQSVFYKMRLYHNWIKRQLLLKYANRVDSLLDLSCGKGGDIDKWVSSKIKRVVGYDINPDSIKEAQARLKEHYLDDDMAYQFKILDLSCNVIPEAPVKFDVVTSMFAFHYMFANEESLETILASIKNNLKVGGYFIGCLFDGATIQSLMAGTGKFVSSDKSFHIIRKTALSRELFGNKIEVFMNETVLDQPTDEYLVDFDLLVQSFQSQGLQLVESHMFKDYYQTWVSNHDDLSIQDQTISFLNRTFVFQRVE